MSEIPREYSELSEKSESLKKIYSEAEITMLAEGLASYLAEMSDRMAKDGKLEPNEIQRAETVKSTLEPILPLLQPDHAEEITDVIDYILKEDAKNK